MTPHFLQLGAIHCPKRGSARLHRSRRHSMLDHALARLGARLRRCHDCRCRRAWFGFYTVPVGDSARAKLAERTVIAVAAAASLAALWWAISRTRPGAG
jgi:hypothetical protein